MIALDRGQFLFNAFLLLLSPKASRDLFSIKQNIFNNNIRPSAVLKIFDALVKPIALYDSQIWVGFKSCFQKKINRGNV